MQNTNKMIRYFILLLILLILFAFNMPRQQTAPLVVLLKNSSCVDFERVVKSNMERPDLDDIIYDENRLSDPYKLQEHRDLCTPVFVMLQNPNRCPGFDWGHARTILRCDTSVEDASLPRNFQMLGN